MEIVLRLKSENPNVLCAKISRHRKKHPIPILIFIVLFFKNKIVTLSRSLDSIAGFRRAKVFFVMYVVWVFDCVMMMVELFDGCEDCVENK